MKKNSAYNILNIVTVIAVTMFFSCTNNFKEVQKVGVSENEPVGLAENINFKYTDSGKIKAILVSSKMLDYTNRDFPFREFPNGATMDVFDDENNKSVIVADYAMIYDGTGLIDLQGNVVITTHDGNILKTDQLYFDKTNEWLFSNHPVEITSNDGSLMKGNVFDSNRHFTLINIYEMNDSSMVIEE